LWFGILWVLHFQFDFTRAYPVLARSVASLRRMVVWRMKRHSFEIWAAWVRVKSAILAILVYPWA